MALLVAGVVGSSVWKRRASLDEVEVVWGAGALALLAAFATVRDGTHMAFWSTAWWLAFFAVLRLSADDRLFLIQVCLWLFGAQIVATLGAYFLGYYSFLTPRFGARAGGLMSSPNEIYPWSLIWAALFWAAAHQAPSLAVRRWLWAGAAGSIAVLLLTFSRAGWIGLAAVMPFLWPRSPSGTNRWAPWAIAGVLLLGAATIRTRGEILSVENDGSTRGRALIYQASWQLFGEKPLLGHGVGQIARRNDLGIDFVEPKNIYAQFALEHGLVGLALFAVFVVGVLQRARRLISLPDAEPSAQWAARALILALPALLVAGLFDTPIFGHFERIVPTIAFLLLAGILAAESPLLQGAEVAPSPSVPETKGQHGPHRVETAFNDLDAALRNIGVDYFVIGSCARLAYLEELGAVSDIDILIFDAKQRGRAQDTLRLVSQRSGVTVDDSLSRFFELQNGAYFLVYGRLRVPVEARIFEKRIVRWQSAALPTFPPQTLLHFFNCLVAAPLRPKDKATIYQFARFVRSRREFDHALYLPFHFFVGRWRYFPLRRLQLGWRLMLKKASPKLRLWVLKSYQTAPSRAVRAVLNALVPFVFVGLKPHGAGRSRWAPKRRNGAFTLTEILMVLGIVAVLAAMLFPVISQARERGRRAVCSATLAEFGRAFQLYSQDYDGRFPNPGGRGMQANGALGAVEAGENGAAWYSAGQVVNEGITDRGGLILYMGRVSKTENNDWSCPNAMDAASPSGLATRAIGQSYTMNDYLRAGHPGQAVLSQEDAPARFNPSYHTGISTSQIGARDGHSASDVILLYEAVQRNSGSVNRNGSPYWGRDWLSRYGMDDLPQGAPEEYHQGLSNFLFCDGHVKALRPVVTWTPATQPQLVRVNPSYATARGGRSGVGTVDAWNPRLAEVHYP